MQRPGSRYAMVASVLAGLCVVLACAALVQSSAGGLAVEALQEMLCCDGCCAASTSIASAIISSDAAGSRASQSGRSTILHMAGSSEIDYTAGGHRVSQHMESALSELDNLENHVKAGRPKFLTESAAQREADLMSDKFAHQDLAGKKVTVAPKSKEGLVDPYEQAEEAQLKQTAEKKAPSKASTVVYKKAERTEQVAEATRLSMGVKRQQAKDSKSFSEPLHIISKDLHSAESDAAREMKSIAHTKVVSTGSALPRLDDPAKAVKEQASSEGKSASSEGKSTSARAKAQPRGARPDGSGFQPITSSGWKHVLRARSDAAASAARLDLADAKDEDILRKLAQRDLEHAKSAHIRQASVSDGAAGQKPMGVTTSTATSGEGAHKLKLPSTRHAHRPVESQAAAQQGKDVKGTKAPQRGETRLNGVLSRINKLINTQTGGASEHPSYFKHFDTAEAKAEAAKLAAMHKQAQAVLAAHSSAVHLQQDAQLGQASGGSNVGGADARVGEAGDGGGGAGAGAAVLLQPATVAAGSSETQTSPVGHGNAARLSASGDRPRVGSHAASLRQGGERARRATGAIAQLREVRGGMGRENERRIRDRQPDALLAGSGVALKEEAMLYGSHHDLDRQGAKALKESSLIGLGL